MAIATVFAIKTWASLSLGARGVSRFIDDAFYYIIIARNFSQTGVPTFDGVNATNGFHPLWMLMLAAMYRVIGATSDLFTQIVAVKTLEALVLACALAVCVGAFHRLRDSTPVAWGFLGAALVMLAPQSPWLFEQGMESTLAAGLLMMVIYAALAERRALLAAGLPLLFLARLDTLVFAIAPLTLAWVLRKPGAWKSDFKLFVPLAVVVAIYLGLNIVFTGHATPISGQIKSSFPALTLHLNFLLEPWEIAPLAGWETLVTVPNPLAACAAWVLLALVCLWQRRESWARTVAVVLLVVALLIANIVLFQRWDKGVEPRYLALPYAMLGFAGMALLGGLARRRAWVSSVVVLTLAVACGIATVKRFSDEPGRSIDLRSAHSIRKLASPADRFAGTDIGAISFWLDRPFVNLDGLVNNRELQVAIRQGQFACYLEKKNVRYLLLAFWDSAQTHISRPTERMYRSRIFAPAVAGPGYEHYDFRLYSYLYDTDSEPLRLYPRQEVFRESAGRDGTANAAIVIYRLEPANCP